MAVLELKVPKDIHTVYTYYYTLYIHQISFQYLLGNMVKLTNITNAKRTVLYSQR